MERALRSRTFIPRRALALLGVAAGCGGSTGPQVSPDVGVIDAADVQPPTGVIEAPATVRAGADFPVTVRTYGSGCTSAAGAAVTYPSPGVAVVVPYDNARTPAGAVCAAVLLRPAHVVTLRFTVPGAATVRVEGRREPGSGAAVVDAPVTVTGP